MAIPSTSSRIYVLSNITSLTSQLSALMPHLKFVEIPYTIDETRSTTEQTVSTEQMKYLQEAEILIADPLLLGGYVQEMPNLKWMQSTWAGVDSIFRRIDKNKALPSFPLTRLAGAFGPAMAEFTLAHILAHERRIVDVHEDKKRREWLGRTRADYRILSTLSIGILGLGDIGAEVAKYCKYFGMTVWGLVRRDVAKEQQSKYVDHYRLNSQMSEVLKSCDYICSLLPSTTDTRDMLSGDLLSACKEKKPVFINVGRGDVIDEASIINAIRSGWISKAVLDVHKIEPLPQDSLLWDEPNVFISPHASVCSPPEMIFGVFKENMEHYSKGEPLKYSVNWETGY
ncbi:glyoxylate/hydroxypyruvate reductase A-like [Lineus longissimus]|uniref:glyoxylate/hydroxypyruvate reductase A-like n=1 Tax=Lineus longissimus TaxID=88925 RepID=UPI00315C54E5